MSILSSYNYDHYKCGRCGQVFKNKEQLEQHCFIEHCLEQNDYD